MKSTNKSLNCGCVGGHVTIIIPIAAGVSCFDSPISVIGCSPVPLMIVSVRSEKPICAPHSFLSHRSILDVTFKTVFMLV